MRGILNGTCAYILSRMQSEPISFADALAEAQKAMEEGGQARLESASQPAALEAVVLATAELAKHAPPPRPVVPPKEEVEVVVDPPAPDTGGGPLGGAEYPVFVE